MAEISILGDTFADIQTGPLKKLPVWGGDVAANNIKILLGGSSSNTARYLCEMQSKVRLFSCIGNDDIGKILHSRLIVSGAKLDGSLLVLPESSTPAAIIMYGDNDRSFISNRGCLSVYSTDHINKDLLFESSHLHFGGYFVCLGMQTDSLVDLLKEVKSRGITISMDCQFDSCLEWRGRDDNLIKVLPLLDIFMPNEFEALGITKTESIFEALNWLAARMPDSLVVVKNGENGAFYRLPSSLKTDRPGEIHHVPARRTAVVDTTGAGDCFNAGFLFQLLKEGHSGDGCGRLRSPAENCTGRAFGIKRQKSDFLGEENVRSAVEFGCSMGTKCVESEGAFVEGLAKSFV